MFNTALESEIAEDVISLREETVDGMWVQETPGFCRPATNILLLLQLPVNNNEWYIAVFETISRMRDEIGSARCMLINRKDTNHSYLGLMLYGPV